LRNVRICKSRCATQRKRPFHFASRHIRGIADLQRSAAKYGVGVMSSLLGPKKTNENKKTWSDL
jgi:hypothetical protein